MATISHKERAERLFRWKQDPVKALSESATKEQATRVLTAKLRVERLAREARLVAKTRTSRGTTHHGRRSGSEVRLHDHRSRSPLPTPKPEPEQRAQVRVGLQGRSPPRAGAQIGHE